MLHQVSGVCNRFLVHVIHTHAMWLMVHLTCTILRYNCRWKCSIKSHMQFGIFMQTYEGQHRKLLCIKTHIYTLIFHIILVLNIIFYLCTFIFLDHLIYVTNTRLPAEIIVWDYFGKITSPFRVDLQTAILF